MLKRLRIYYFYVSLPFAALLLGAAWYSDLIAKTVTSNPHPQINYAIFAIILLGGVLILHGIRRQMQEAKALSQYSDAVRSAADSATLQQMAINLDVDIAYVLRMLAASSGRAISHQEQVAIDHEVEKASMRLNSRMALPQFLSGLLVGLGLLGTFVGLLSTLGDISALISSFADVDMANANPVDVFRTMIERMKAPMQSMGIAFSASLFGLLGSIILGFMMVGTRRCLGDILSLLGSEVAQHIEFALASTDGFAYSKGALKQGLGRQKDGTASAIDLLARAALPALARQEGSPSGDAAAAGGGDASPGATLSETPDETEDAPSGAMPASVRASVALSGMPSASLAEPTSGVSVPRLKDTARRESPLVPEEFVGEELRVLRRIEDRLAETARLQLRSLNMEIDDFQKQRGDLLRVIAESNGAMNDFRGELQRVGRQMGTILGIMEKGNVELLAQLSEMMVRTSDNAEEVRKLMIIQIEEQRRVSDALNAVR